MSIHYFGVMILLGSLFLIETGTERLLAILINDYLHVLNWHLKALGSDCNNGGPIQS